MIDAEIGMKYQFSGSGDVALLQTALNSGEMLGPSDSVSSEMAEDGRKDFENYDPEKLSAFLEDVRERLSFFKSRIVLLNTTDLFQYRKCFLQGGDWSELYYSDLNKAVENYFHRFFTVTKIIKKEDCIEAAKEDFSRGRIPFFELSFASGEVKQILPGKEIPIVTYQDQKAGTFLEAMIKNRKNALRDEHNKIVNDTLRASKEKLTMVGVALLCMIGGAYYHSRFCK